MEDRRESRAVTPTKKTGGHRSLLRVRVLALMVLALAASLLSVQPQADAEDNRPTDIRFQAERCLRYPTETGYGSNPTVAWPQIWSHDGQGPLLSEELGVMVSNVPVSSPNSIGLPQSMNVAAEDVFVYYAGQAQPGILAPGLDLFADVNANRTVVNGNQVFNHRTMMGTRLICAEEHYVFVDPSELNLDNPVFDYDTSLYLTGTLHADQDSENWVRSLYYVSRWVDLAECMQENPDSNLQFSAAALRATDQGYCFTVFHHRAADWAQYLADHSVPSEPVLPGDVSTWEPPTNIEHGDDYDDRHGNFNGRGAEWDATIQWWRCDGEIATDVARPEGGLLRGTNGRDVLVGLGGDDVIIGRRGNDIICGGGGDDFIDAGKGNDFVHGGDGDDKIEGLPGNDVLVGGAGDDEISGGAQDDRLYGGDGADIMHGDNSIDWIYGGAGNDQLFGEKYKDYIEGGPGDDEADGGVEPQLSYTQSECEDDIEVMTQCD